MSSADKRVSSRGMLSKPVFGWRSFETPSEYSTGHAPVPSIEQLASTQVVSSGRAAIYHALALMGLEAGSEVLVPTYHCPTMVAPIVALGLRPRFFATDANGLPLLTPAEEGPTVKAIIVPHYFGRAQSLAGVRSWCDARGVLLIEDCAHCYFGQAGELPVGAWGDYATASVTKFLPVPEAGILASARRPVPGLALRPTGVKRQIKEVVDLLEYASRFDSLPGLNGLLRLLFALKNRRSAPVTANPQTPVPQAEPDVEQAVAACDLSRVKAGPSFVARWVMRALPRNRIVLRRRQAHAILMSRLTGLKGVRPLWPSRASVDVPYVFPLWVETPELADEIYAQLRAGSHAVFRWDRLWPGTPTFAGDSGRQWSRQVLQLLCHQDISPAAAEATAAAIADVLAAYLPNRAA